VEAYNFCDSVWRFDVKDSTLTVDQDQSEQGQPGKQALQLKSAKIVCCDQKVASYSFA
jgi:hypothetical protein